MHHFTLWHMVQKVSRYGYLRPRVPCTLPSVREHELGIFHDDVRKLDVNAFQPIKNPFQSHRKDYCRRGGELIGHGGCIMGLTGSGTDRYDFISSYLSCLLWQLLQHADCGLIQGAWHHVLGKILCGIVLVRLAYLVVVGEKFRLVIIGVLA